MQSSGVSSSWHTAMGPSTRITGSWGKTMQPSRIEYTVRQLASTEAR